MSADETTLYPTDILKSKYKTVLEASQVCNCSIPTILDLVKSNKIPYAEFKVEGVRSRLMHVNPEDVNKALGRETSE